MRLQSHQKGTLDYLEKRCTNQHGLLVFHNMGTGKTITAVSWLMNRRAQYKKTAGANTAPRTTMSPPAVSHTSKRKRHSGSTTATTPKRKRQKNMKPKRTQRRNRGGYHSEQHLSSRRSSRESRTSRSSVRRATPTASREFDYVVVCPENIKSSWHEDANKLGFKIDMDKVINYEKVQGKVQAKEFDVRGKNVIFDEAHHLCKIMRYENMQYYTDVLHALSQADKLLLMTGTPEHGGKSDFMILVNLVARRNKFPVHDKQLYEMYRKNDIFQKRKNSIFFNWIKPVAWTAFLSIYNYIHSRLYRKLREWTYLYLFKKYNLSLHDRAKKYVTLSERGQMHEEDFGGDDMYGGGFFGSMSSKMPGSSSKSGLSAAMSTEASKLTDEATSNIKNALSVIPTSRSGARSAVGDMFDSAVDEELENYADQGVLVVHEIAKEIDNYVKAQPTRSIMSAFQKYAFATFGFLQVTHNPEIALAQAPMDLERMSRDIGRYVSFYQQPSDSLDYGKTKIAPPVEALYSIYQSQQCLFFIFGTMTERMVKFYANVDSDGAKLKINEFRTMKGVWKYGRCISNMWGIVDCILDRQVKYLFNSRDGTVQLCYRDREHPSSARGSSSSSSSRGDHKRNSSGTHKRSGGRAKSQSVRNSSSSSSKPSPSPPAPKIVKNLGGCSKFKNVERMINEAARKGQRTLIRSDFKKQGIYLLSAYLNSVGIPHYYIRSSMSPEGRSRILNEFNSVYRPVQVGGKKRAVVLEYVDDTKPLDDHAQIYVGVTVAPVTANGTWSAGRVIRVGDKAGNNKTVDVLYDELKRTHVTVRISEIKRVLTVRYDNIIGSDGKAKQQVVPASELKLLPYDGPKTAEGKPLPQVMLLDKDSSEGISLMGIEHVHLLEPLLSVAERDQSLARAVRYQSHRHLPPSRHLVHVHTHIGVVKPSKRSMDSAKAMLQAQLFDTEKNAHINKHFAGVVPRAAKGTIKTDPVGYMFDKYWNAVPVLHSGFDGTSSTPDTMVLGRISADAKHIGAYTSRIRQHNVLYKDFSVPDDCEPNRDFQLKTENF